MLKGASLQELGSVALGFNSMLELAHTTAPTFGVVAKEEAPHRKPPRFPLSLRKSCLTPLVIKKKKEVRD